MVLEPLDPASFVCPDCGEVGTYKSFVARPVEEFRWWWVKRLLGYEVKGGGFLKVIRINLNTLERTREIMS